MDTKVLPLAVAMMAGPQIMTSVVLVTGQGPVKTSLAYVGAIASAVVAGTAVAMLIAKAVGSGITLHKSSGTTTAAHIIELALVALLLLAAVRSYLGRATAEPPKWLGKLQTAGPREAFRFGLLLIFLMPTDVVIMLTTGIHLEGEGKSLVDASLFFAATVLIAALPALGYVAFRRRAAVAMPKVRDWMNSNSWLVNIFVYALFIVLILA